jgi:protein-tyrosine phosphatase
MMVAEPRWRGEGPGFRRITDRLYQGGFISARDAPTLRSLGITDLLNLDLPYLDWADLEANGFRIHHFLLPDMSRLKEERVAQVLDLLERILSGAGLAKVYVHCNAGLSRSPTIAWLHLVASGTPEDEATRIVAPDGALLGLGVLELARELARRRHSSGRSEGP